MHVQADVQDSFSACVLRGFSQEMVGINQSSVAFAPLHQCSRVLKQQTLFMLRLGNTAQNAGRFW